MKMMGNRLSLNLALEGNLMPSNNPSQEMAPITNDLHILKCIAFFRGFLFPASLVTILVERFLPKKSDAS